MKFLACILKFQSILESIFLRREPLRKVEFFRTSTSFGNGNLNIKSQVDNHNYFLSTDPQSLKVNKCLL